MKSESRPGKVAHHDILHAYSNGPERKTRSMLADGMRQRRANSSVFSLYMSAPHSIDKVLQFLKIRISLQIIFLNISVYLPSCLCEKYFYD